MLKNIIKPQLLSIFTKRNVHISPVSRLREVVINKTEKKTTIEGRIKSTGREHHMYKIPNPENRNACLLCRLGLDIKHTDVLILSQFVAPDGVILPRRLTGLCKTQNRRLVHMVEMARQARLMPNPKVKSEDELLPYKRNNTYFDERTINMDYGKIFERCGKCKIKF